MMNIIEAAIMLLSVSKRREWKKTENYQTHGVGSIQILFQLQLSSTGIEPNKVQKYMILSGWFVLHLGKWMYEFWLCLSFSFRPNFVSFDDEIFVAACRF